LAVRRLEVFSRGMFTGIVEETGKIVEFREGEGSWRLKLEAGMVLDDLKDGDSLAVNGCCLTVCRIEGQVVGFDLLGETVRLTSISGYEAGMEVNLERSLTPSTRMGGHFVTGHIDGMGEILVFEKRGMDTYLEIRPPEGFMDYLIYKGSIAVDGISLTVAEVGTDRFSIWLIPHTLEVTNLLARKVGDRVNLEFDMLAKYVKELLEKQMRPNYKMPDIDLP
jgi:riboflavin synthase